MPQNDQDEKQPKAKLGRLNETYCGENGVPPLATISSLSGPPIKRATHTARKKGPLAGRKVAPKYRNPTNTKETWAGRGMKPKWLVTALKGGKKLESFAVKK
jgi:hypothetical protein